MQYNFVWFGNEPLNVLASSFHNSHVLIDPLTSIETPSVHRIIFTVCSG